MRHSLTRLVLAFVFALVPAMAQAQGASAGSSITGVVVDTAGGVVPGASVTVKNNATGVTFEAVTNTAGTFAIPTLDAGTYTVTVALTGFKTAVINDVRLLAATPSEIKATLEVGSLTESVQVSSRAELVQTQSSAITSTIGLDQITNLPLVSRNALNFITFLPGVDTAGINRDSTVSGLPQSTLNITIDGVNVQDNFNKTGDGFFARVNPRLDAVEEVTVTSATQGANAAGQGAVQIAFQTRSGTNQYTGSVYHYFRHPDLNSNYYFNKVNGLDKNEVILNQYGTRVGGPIILPGLYNGRGKAFFFVNYEEFRQPTETTRTRTIMNPRTQEGWFRYNVTVDGQTVVREINVLNLARDNNQLATTDPLIMKMLNQIRAATQGTGNITDDNDPSTQSFIFQAPSTALNRYPTIRLDYNTSDKHRLSGSYNSTRVNSNPDILNGAEPNFPGFLNYGSQISNRHSMQGSLRSTFTSNLVNELRIGGGWGTTFFGPERAPSQFVDQDNYNITLGFDLTGLTDSANPSSRQAANWTIENTANWLKGTHNISFGGAFTRFPLFLTNQTVVPGLSMGFDTTNDPAAGLFNSTRFPGASNNQLGDARQLYAILTGRVTTVSGISQINENTNSYEFLGPRTQRGQMDEYGFFVQDSWRFRPNLTINYGLRYELQLPFQATNDVMSMATYADICGISGQGAGPQGRGCNLFQPGTLTGIRPVYVQYDSGSPGYNTDKNNFAPNIGAAWRPNVQDGWLRKLLGDPDQATVRGAYSVAYNRNGMGDFTGVFGSNPGSQISANRTANLGNLVYPGETWPLLMRDRSRLGPPGPCPTGTVAAGCIPDEPVYPILATTANSINIFDPDLQVSFSRSWSAGFQRSLTRDMAFEIRYIGTRNLYGWTTENWNEMNIVENGFLDEFKRAQANLVANQTAGRGNTFAYTGVPGTSPLPLYLAFFSARTAAEAHNPALYTSGNFSNTDWLGHLSRVEPDPLDAANDLYGNAGRRTNLFNAGYAQNTFLLNPDASSANITRSQSGTKYHSMQAELRRRFSRGLSVNANYTFAVRKETALDTLRRARILVPDTEGVRHAFKLNWVFESPYGRGKRFGTDISPWLNGVLGDWEFHGTGRVQSGDLLTLTGVRLYGMTEAELADAFEVRVVKDPTSGATKVYSLPQDIIDNTRRAFNSDPTTTTGYGELGPPTGRYIGPESTADCIALEPGDCTGVRNIYVNGPMFTRFDFSLVKRVRFTQKVNFELRIDILNVFDNVNFNTPFQANGNATLNEVTSGYTDINNTNDPGGRLGQIVWRLNW